MLGRFRDWAHLLRREAHALYLAARDPRTPWYAKALALFIAGYALSPIDLIPDPIPLLGYLDDIVLIPLGIWIVIRLIPEEIMVDSRAAASKARNRPTSTAAALVIICVWVAAIALTGWLAYRYF